MALRRFPSGRYGRQRLEFFPAPFRAPLRAFASMVFPWHGDQILLCDIYDRGWCIPSGRVEPDEHSRDAAWREAREESGAVLDEPLYIGCYRITERNEVKWADVYTARVRELREITHLDESRGRRFLDYHELPNVYHMWNPLLALVFEHSRAVLARAEDYAISCGEDVHRECRNPECCDEFPGPTGLDPETSPDQS